MMKNKAYLLIILSALLILGSAQTALAAPHIENVSLKKQGDFVELTIYADGPFTFSHFIEEAKAGKPYRVVLDLKQALHKLPQFNFRELPTDVITAIRTSQYKIKPDKVVRIVADVSRPVTYTLKQGEGRVTIVFAAPEEGEFQFWCAAPIDENEKIKLALTETETVTVDKPAKMPAHPEAERKAEDEGKFNPPSNTNKEPEASKPSDGKADTKQKTVKSAPETGFSAAERQELKAKMAEIFENGGEHKEKAEKEAEPPVKPAPEKKALASTGDKKSESVKSEVKKNDESSKKVTPVSENADSKKALSDSQAITPSDPVKVIEDNEPDQAPQPKKPGSSEDDAEESKSKKWKSEKELRKNPTRPTKVKGSLAASFPKREVVKYRSYGRRDPFLPLVSKSLSGYQSGEMPDVETLRLVGVLQGNYENMALLEDMEGYGYILENGDDVKNGYVIEIYRDKILFQISEFGWSRTVALTMELED
ncbi:MAG: hypothetical protein GF310_09985 [candidate division Zixibacteria bacterium]|nr:hypothetical protein [candidate division Zixibacteria bacterium]